jgi:hypothetical protein
VLDLPAEPELELAAHSPSRSVAYTELLVS